MLGPLYLYHPLGQCAGNVHEVLRCKSYNFWSGIGSDLAYVTIALGALVTAVRLVRLYRKHTECHVDGCSKHGQPVHGTPYRACHDHHPLSMHEAGEPITAAHIAAAHVKAGL